MPQSDQDRPNTIHWPPILYGITLVAAWGVQRLVPIEGLLPEAFRVPFGVPLLGIGLGIGALAIFRFRRDGTSFDPTARAKALATGGIYRLTRNPMYLGAIVAFVGLGLWLANSWLVVLIPVMALALQKLAIEREEAYLRQRFGADYDNYCSRVRRWI